MNEGGNSLGPATTIYEECSFLCRNFSEIVFYYCPREANMATHVLASHAEGAVSIFWHDDPLDFFVNVLADDVSVISN
jgi:hypothetical protein